MTDTAQIPIIEGELSTVLMPRAGAVCAYDGLPFSVFDLEDPRNRPVYHRGKWFHPVGCADVYDRREGLA